MDKSKEDLYRRLQRLTEQRKISWQYDLNNKTYYAWKEQEYTQVKVVVNGLVDKEYRLVISGSTDGRGHPISNDLRDAIIRSGEQQWSKALEKKILQMEKETQ